MNLYCVVQCTYVSSNPLCYTNIRSVYTADERYKQELETLKSIREKDKNSYIILCEQSSIEPEKEIEFKKYIHKYYNFSNDIEISFQRDSPYKGPTELMSLLRVINDLSEKEINNINFFIKVGGRYTLTDKYNIENFDKNYINVYKSSDAICTVLYAIPVKFLMEFKKMLEKTISITKNSPISIENILFSDCKNLNILNYIGIKGNVAVNGILNII